MKKRKKKPALTPGNTVCEHGELTMTLGGVSFKGSLTSLVRQYDDYKKTSKRKSHS